MSAAGMEAPEAQNRTRTAPKLEARGVTFDGSYAKGPDGVASAWLTDPWGTSIELNERPNPVYLP